MTYRQYRIEIVINLALVGLAVVGAVIWIGYPLWIFGGQIIHWLREGDWVPFSTRTMLTEFGLRVPEVEWQGVQKIINFIASLPAGVMVLLLGWALGSLLLHMLEEQSRDIEATEREHPEWKRRSTSARTE